MGEIRTTAEAAANTALSPSVVQDIRVEPAIGSEGQDILRITIILDDAVFDAMKDDDFLKALLSIKKNIRDLGEDRQAVVGYATQAELDDDGDPES